MATPRNPSEIQRLQEEGLAILDTLSEEGSSFGEGYFRPDKGYKAGREALLRELRTIERTLEIESTPYNNTSFYERSRDALLYLRRRTD